MKNKICIVGANSKVVQSISWPEQFHLISHNDLPHQDLDQFSSFVVFSWSHSCVEDNENIFQKLRGRKVAFISTISVFSLILRPQWNSYPNEKSRFEKLYWSAGASIVRLGICFDNYDSHIPYSSPAAILQAIIVCVNGAEQRVITPVEIKFRKKMSSLEMGLHRLSYLSRGRIWRMMCEVIVKVFIRKYIPLYGYTADVVNMLVRPLQAGYGAVGSRDIGSPSRQIIVDPRPNLLLEKNGFKDTWVGRDIIGLSKTWHGVQIVEKGDYFHKKVPFFVRRKKPPFDAIQTPIALVDFAKKTLMFDTEVIVKPEMPYHCLYLAMGPIKNSIEISKNFNETIHLSDHSIGSIGTIRAADLIKAGYLKRLGCFLIGRRIYRGEKNDFILDFRPFIAGDQGLNKNFYNEQARGIIYKLIKRFSFQRLNQAFFNKFGICFWQSRIDGWIQILMDDCIATSGDDVQRKNDLTKIHAVQKEIITAFPSMDLRSEVSLFDAQHIMGGRNVFEKVSAKDMKIKYGIEVLGVPNESQPNAFHHTWSLIEKNSK